MIGAFICGALAGAFIAVACLIPIINQSAKNEDE